MISVHLAGRWTLSKMALGGEKAERSWRSGRRRRWTAAEKRRIVAESEVAGSSISMVARRHDLNANLLFAWRRALRRRDAEARVDGPAFVPAIVVAEEVEAGRARRERRATLEDGSGERPRGLMEIVLASGRRVIVDGEVSVAALARVIDVLDRR
jgi:transposase